jgi:hypothetical protein
MPYDPALWVKLAEDLVTHPVTADEQARYRTAINRCYYGPLIRLKLRIEVVQGAGSVPGPGVHSWMQRALKNAASNHHQRIRSALRRLEDGRTEADYDSQTGPFTVDDVRAAVERAQRAVALIDGLPVDSLRRIRA